MKLSARSIFDNAQAYNKAAQLLNVEGDSDPAMLLPSIVNAALSLELYFKSLYVLDHGSEFKVNEKHSHDFATLFDGLKINTRQQLRSQFKTALSLRNNNDIYVLENSYKIVIPRDLKGNLVQWVSLFVDLRYAYYFVEKYKERQKTMLFYPEIRASVFMTIINREPTWKPSPHRLYWEAGGRIREDGCV